jgi:hypothetical protein
VRRACARPPAAPAFPLLLLCSPLAFRPGPIPHPHRHPSPLNPNAPTRQVTTVDKYQGQQNDYVLLSLVRTKAVGHFRDVRRLVVALSRARLGLYVFGRVELFSNCYELRPAFARLLQRPTQVRWRALARRRALACAAPPRTPPACPPGARPTGAA